MRTCRESGALAEQTVCRLPEHPAEGHGALDPAGEAFYPATWYKEILSWCAPWPTAPALALAEGLVGALRREKQNQWDMLREDHRRPPPLWWPPMIGLSAAGI